MSSSSGLDVRLPIGGLFTALGVLLGGYGLATAGDATHYARSMSVNINLWWGLVMLAFGLSLFVGHLAGPQRYICPSPCSRLTASPESATMALGFLPGVPVQCPWKPPPTAVLATRS